MKKFLLGILVLFFVLVFILGYGIPYITLKKADKLFQNKDYRAAIELYDSIQVGGRLSEESSASANECRYLLAEQALENGDYDAAITLYTELGDNDKVRSVGIARADEMFKNGDYHHAAELYQLADEPEMSKNAWYQYAKQCIDATDYENAINTYISLNDYAKETSTRKTWAAQLFDDGEYIKAEEQYLLIGDQNNAWAATSAHISVLIDQQREDEVLEWIRDYTGIDVAQQVFNAAMSKIHRFPNSHHNQIAFTFGSCLKDVDTQLAYCELLRKEGYSLQEVYPDGVTVDADLAAYQFFTMAVSEKEEVDLEKFIAFSREDFKPSLDVMSASSKQEADKRYDKYVASRESKEFTYEVKLLPGLMEQFPEILCAQNMAEATALLLVEKGFYPDNQLTIRTRTVSNSQNTTVNTANIYEFLGKEPPHDNSTYQTLFGYTAYEAISIYNIDNPVSGTIAAYYADSSIISDCIVGNTYQEKNIKLTTDEIDAILKALEDPESEESVALFAQYPQSTIDFVSQNGWGTYIYIPDGDETGNSGGRTYTSDEIDQLNIEKYMLGKHDDQWFEQEIQNDLISNLLLYILLN